MLVMRRYIFALLVAGLLLVQLGQAQHYKTHFLEPAYQRAPQKHAPAHSDADDNCAFCLFLKNFTAVLAVSIAIAVCALAYTLPDFRQIAFAALLLRQNYTARAPPAA